MNVVESVIDVVVTTLDIAERKGSFTADSPLLGSVPELDSLAVMELLVNLESQFGITMDDEDVSGETFETIGSLAAVVSEKL
jgi:acyl carrier protein